MIQKIDLTKNNWAFGALIPKAKYTGKPKLPQQAIDGIKTIRKLIVKTEGDIIELESKLEMEKPKGNLVSCLKSKIEILQLHKQNLEAAIYKIKLTREYIPRAVSYMEALKDRRLRQMENIFQV